MNYKSIFLLICFCLISGCQTYTALNQKTPEEYIEIVSSDSTVNIEDSLKASGVKYTCKELFFGNNSAKNRRACYVKAPEKSRFSALGIKLQDAPEAMLTDAGNAALVVGKVAINLYLLSMDAKHQ